MDLTGAAERRRRRLAEWLALTVIGLSIVGCGTAGGERPRDSTATQTTSNETRIDPKLRCQGAPKDAVTDPTGDLAPLGGIPAEREVDAPAVDLVEARLVRSGPTSLCISLRTAGKTGIESSFALETIQASLPGSAGAQYEINRYELGRDMAGEPYVTRPAGEPRYPVAAEVALLPKGAEVALLELAAHLPPRFGWRATSTDGSTAEDALPSNDPQRWQLFRADEIVATSAFTRRRGQPAPAQR